MWLLITKESASGIETTARNKDGIEFPVIVTVTISSSTGNSTTTANKITFVAEKEEACTLFVRDLRDIKGYQKLIEQNEILLLKMLPKSIAAKLRASVFSQAVTKDLLVAGTLL